MGNPARYGGTSPNKATAPSSKVNSLSPLVPRVKNTFDLTHQICQTERFADVMPFFVMDCVPNDDVKMESNIDQRPQSTFASPLMTTFRKHRSYFAVPRSAIYRRNYQQLFVNPKKGDDVDFSNVVACVNYQDLYKAVSSILRLFSSFKIIQSTQYLTFFKTLALLHSIFSEYSLLSYLELNPLNYNLTGQASKKAVSFDSLFQDLINAIVANDTAIKLQFTGASNSMHFYALQWDSFVDYFMETSLDADAVSVSLVKVSTGSAITSLPDFSAKLNAIDVFFEGQINTDVSTPGVLINIERIVAYQMCMSQFYTNDNVDDIYTGELWYQNVDGLVASMVGNSGFSNSSTVYTWNGVRLRYEPYSGKIISTFLSLLDGVSLVANIPVRIIDYFLNIFTIGHSLRFGDMFNSARLEPLAVGDYSAPITSNEVSAVDMTKATLMQRFLNAVNSVRNTIKGYAQMLFGVVPDDLAPEPRFIAHSVIEIGSNIVANTGDNQGNLETNLVLHDSRPEFDIHVNQECIILGLSHYDCLQLYPRPLSPMALKIDRMDYFNPMLQNIGDQPVKTALMTNLIPNSAYSLGNIFGYLQNDFEYKQSLNQARGAYITGALVGASQELGRSTWAFIVSRKLSPALTSMFIRNFNSDFDIFYKSLTGFGVNYFHFVCSYVNQVIASRPMNYVSNILFNSSI